MKPHMIAVPCLFLASSAVLASVQDVMPQTRSHEERIAACKEDAVKFCADKTGRQLRACLRYNAPSLSRTCKASLSSMPGGKLGLARR